MQISRRQFVIAAPLAATGLVSLSQTQNPTTYDIFPSQDPEKVRSVVGASHANFARVKELVSGQPALARATWDWGFGDWESALGAASHVGNREIAQYLVDNGARPDIFFHAMMGHLDVVKAAVSAQPGVQRIQGPHGITLMAHARNGGDEAKAVVAYLESLGDADQKQESKAITDAEKEVYIGRYSFGEGKNDAFIVDKNRQGMLWIRRPSEPNGRNLHKREAHEFSPPGCPRVRIKFKVENGLATSLSIHDPGLILTAVRQT